MDAKKVTGRGGRQTTGSPKPDNPFWYVKGAAPWPYKPEDSSVLMWWRRLPIGLFQETERSLLLATLRQLSVIGANEDVAAALKGDPAAAVRAALSLMPIEHITLTVDIAMTALVRTALDRSSTSALVMTQVILLTELGHEFATGLAASWFAYGRQCSSDPRKFSEAEEPLLAAFRARNKCGPPA